MATVPNNKTWSPGNIPTAAEFNTNIRDAINFYKAPPRVLVKNSVVQDLVNATWTALTWNQEDADTDGIHSTSSNTSRLTAVTAGRYFVTISIRWEDHILGYSGVRGVQVRKNSAGAVGSGSCVCIDMRHHQDNLTGSIGAANQSTCGYVYLGVGDYVEAFGYQTDGGNSEVSHTTTSGNRFGAIWVSTL